MLEEWVVTAKDDAERVGVLDLAGNSLFTGLSLVNAVSGAAPKVTRTDLFMCGEGRMNGRCPGLGVR